MKRGTVNFIAGLLIGVVAFGGTTAYAAGILAERSTHPIYVNGQQVQMEAYKIAGHNYVKLRDIGRAVGMNVYWQDGVQVDTSTSYTGQPPAAVTEPDAIRQEMVRLINQVRQEHGVDPLSINEALMAGAQSCSEQRLTDHGPQQWQTVVACGWPHGANANLTYFSLDSNTDVAKKAVQNWVNSPGHLQTMLSERGDCLGVGAAVYGRMAYCFMLVGDLDSVGPLS